MRVISSCLLLLFGIVCSYADPPPTEPIFDGQSLQGWEGDPRWWRVEEGAIVGEIEAGESLPRNQFLFWEGEAHDFDLTLQFRITGNPGANSGIQFRSQKLADGECAGYQADLDDGATWLGRIYDEHGRALLVERGTRVAIAPDGRKWVDLFAAADSFKDLLRPNAWNTYRITAVASHVELRVNDTLCAVLDDREAGEAEFSGRIALQLHSGEGPAKLEFRDIRLADLGRTEPPSEAKTVSENLDRVKSISPTSPDGRPLNFGFETGTLEDWTVEGDAWEGQPSQFGMGTTRVRKTELLTYPSGEYYIGSNNQERDSGTGRLTSEAFVVTHRWASYVVSGGNDIKRTRVEIVDADTGEAMQQSFGDGSDEYHREVIDFAPALGKRIFIRLVDDSDEYGARIGFDDFVFHDREPMLTTASLVANRLVESPVLWHLEPNPAEPTGVENLDAQKVVREMAVTNGFKAELIAAEPDVHQPIAFAFDARGRIWVAEAFSYPNKRPAGEGEDRIVIFEDADGDGSFETHTVFAEGLNLVSGLAIGFGGVWVGAAPELLFIPDADGDDQPDGPPQVLLDGWGYQDTHETLNSFTWGPDGWLYGLQGVFTQSLIGKPGAAREDRLRLRAGIWRYQPLRHEFEIFANGGSNQWGIDFNEMGDLFMTHCRSFHGGGGTTYVIRNGHYWNQANSDYASFVSRSGPPFAPALKNYLPSSARYDSGEGGAGKPGTSAVYGGHSHVGTMIYLGDNWPDAYRDHLFTHNLHGQQINHQHNVRQGSGYETFHAGYDMLFAPDPTYLPVDLNYGPDGAVYMIDWCDHQHCHSPVNEVWERGNGRIYRLAWADTWEPKRVDLRTRSDAELAALHTHKSEWFVRTARRLLQERSAKRPIEPSAVAALTGQARQAKQASHRLRALWTLHVAGTLDSETLESALADPVNSIRGWAIRLATQGGDGPTIGHDKLVQLASEDASPVVRLALASAAPTLPDEVRWTLCENLARRAEDVDDRFLPKMLWFALAPLVSSDFGRTLEIAQRAALPSLTDSIHWYLARSADGRDRLVEGFASGEVRYPERAVRVMAFSLSEEASLPAPSRWPQAAKRLSASASNAETRDAVDTLSALFGDESTLSKTRAMVADDQRTVEERKDALALLKRVGDVRQPSLYIDLLEVEALRSEAIPLIARIDDPSGARRLIDLFERFDPSEKAAALTALTSRASHASALLSAVEEERFDVKPLTALHLRQMRALDDPRVDAALERLWEESQETPGALRQEIARLSELRDGYPMWSLSTENGRATFTRLCVSCHQLDGEGVQLGPDLSGAWRNGSEYFLENIIAPNAVVGAPYQLHVITQRDGSVISGVIESQSDQTLNVRTATETVIVPRNEIENHETYSQSMMPTGLLDGLTDIQVLELLKYLTSEH